MKEFTVHLANNRGETTCQADEYDVRDGALWMLEQIGTRASDRHMRARVTFADGVWLVVHRADVDVDLNEPEPDPPGLRILPAYDLDGPDNDE